MKTATFISLKETQLTHTKVRTINYTEYAIQPYLSTPALSFEESSTFFNARAKTINSFKMCFTSIHKNNLNYKLGCLSQNSLEHCMHCIILNEHVGRSIESFSDIFESVTQQKQAIKTFIKKNKMQEQPSWRVWGPTRALQCWTLAHHLWRVMLGRGVGFDSCPIFPFPM